MMAGIREPDLAGGLSLGHVDEGHFKDFQTESRLTYSRQGTRFTPRQRKTEKEGRKKERQREKRKDLGAEPMRDRESEEERVNEEDLPPRISSLNRAFLFLFSNFEDALLLPPDLPLLLPRLLLPLSLSFNQPNSIHPFSLRVLLFFSFSSSKTPPLPSFSPSPFFFLMRIHRRFGFRVFLRAGGKVGSEDLSLYPSLEL